MNIITQFFVNLENNAHQILTWVFNLIHTTIDCFDTVIEQWVVEEELKQEQDNNNRKNKIGF